MALLRSRIRLTPLPSSGNNPFDSHAVDFDASETQRADDFFASGGGGSGDDDAGGFGSDQSEGMRAPERTEGDDRYFWQIGFWRNMFDVDTKEVLLRLFNSLLPFRRPFVDSIQAKPDLWTPFWICSTLIFFMTWTGNFANYLNTVIAGAEYDVQLEKLPWGAMVVYGYWLVIPLAFWGIFRWKAVPIPLLLCYCIYGYSLFTYIPISIVAIAALGPIQWLSWLLIMLACAYSTITLCFPFFFLVREHEFKLGYILVLVMGLLSVGLGLSFKFYFFAFTPAAPLPTNTTAVF